MDPGNLNIHRQRRNTLNYEFRISIACFRLPFFAPKYSSP
jgi:hypothetical protein